MIAVSMTVNRREVLRQVGQNIRRERTRLGLSQEKLGFVAGVHRNYVGFVERGECSITIISIVKLARALRVPAYRLFKGVA